MSALSRTSFALCVNEQRISGGLSAFQIKRASGSKIDGLKERSPKQEGEFCDLIAAKGAVSRKRCCLSLESLTVQASRTYSLDHSRLAALGLVTFYYHLRRTQSPSPT